MEAILTYLLKSAALLSIFYLVYLVLLKSQTSFAENRKFLLGGIIASAVLPAVYFTRKVFVEANNLSIGEIPVSTNASSQSLTSSWGIWEIFGIIYFLGSAFFLIKIAVQLFNIYLLIRKSNVSKAEKYSFIKTEAKINPFSFFKFIVYNPAAHSENDLKMILLHEKIHAAQWHSVDILIANLNTALLWFNPLSWLYKRSLEQNLEYIADRETVAISGAKKSYQQTLVKVCIPNLQPALTNQFYQSFIKKRILMLNKQSTQSFSLIRISMVFPLILAFMLTFNVKTEAQTKHSPWAIENLQYDESVSAAITKFSKQESFEKISRIFEKFDIELEFSEIEYANEFLTSIKVSFLNKETNETGVFSAANSDGIESFEVFTDKKETGFRKANAFMGKDAISSNGSLLDELGENPLYVINGKKYASKQLDGKHLDISGEGISISLAEEAIAKFGNEAKDGAILANNAKILNDFKEELKRIDKENIETKREFLQIEHRKMPVLISLQNKPDRKMKNKKLGQLSKNNEEISGNPLYILNGEKTKEGIVDRIDPKLIESVNVLKDKKAVSVYGENAKDGAVVVTTKDLEKAEKKDEKKVRNVKSHSVGIQKFQRKTDYKSIRFNDVNYDKNEDINAFQKYEEKLDADKITDYKVNNKIFSKEQAKVSPLVIIDGEKKTTDYMKNELQPGDIEKIEVLKDKNAIEKYGEEAESGVIMITTKKE